MTILGIGALVSVALGLIWWPAVLVTVPLTAAGMAFFRDPNRPVPAQKNAIIAPADGKVSSIHEVDHYQAFDGPATCVRIFLSVFAVHVTRCPCHSKVESMSHKDGAHLNALKPSSVEDNENHTMILTHPVKGYPVAAVRHVAGMLARTIVCHVEQGRIIQRGQRIGLIKLGSTVELYLPADLEPKLDIRQGHKVTAGLTVLATITPKDTGTEIKVDPGSAPNPAQGTEAAQTPEAQS